MKLLRHLARLRREENARLDVDKVWKRRRSEGNIEKSASKHDERDSRAFNPNLYLHPKSEIESRAPTVSDDRRGE